MKRILATTAASVVLLSGAMAFAQTVVTPVETQDTTGGGAAGGAATGAVAGAIVGGPVGALVGGVAGAVAGDVTEDALTPETRVYVLENRVASTPVSGQVVVGTQVPEAVTIREIPDSDYRYAYLNERPVIIEPQTRRVVQIVQ